MGQFCVPHLFKVLKLKVLAVLALIFSTPVVFAQTSAQATSGSITGSETSIDLRAIPLLKISNVDFQVVKPFALRREEVVVKTYFGDSRKQVSYRTYFQGGTVVPVEALNGNAPHCEFEMTESPLGTDSEEFAANYTDQSIVFPVGLASESDPWEIDAETSPKVNLTLFFAHQKEVGKGFTSFFCSDVSVSLNQIAAITGDTISITVSTIAKGGKSDAELLAMMKSLHDRILSPQAKVPSDADLRLGEKWECEILSLKQRSDLSPFEIEYSTFQLAEFLQKDEYRENLYWSGPTAYERTPTALLNRSSFMVVVVFAHEEALITELSTRADLVEDDMATESSAVKGSRLKYPRSVLGPNWDLRLMQVCKPSR